MASAVFSVEKMRGLANSVAVYNLVESSHTLYVITFCLIDKMLLQLNHFSEAKTHFTVLALGGENEGPCQETCRVQPAGELRVHSNILEHIVCKGKK